MYAVDGAARAPPVPSRVLYLLPDGGLERITLDVDDLGPCIRKRARDEAGGVVADHREVNLPVVVPHCRRPRTRVVVEDVACRLRRLARQIVDLVVAVEHRLDDAGIFAGLDLLVQLVALRSARNLNERRHPVEGREDVVEDRAGLNVTGPADDARCPHAAFPGGELSALERRGSAVRKADGLGAVVGGEDDDGVIELAHVLKLLEDEADVVVHLLHAGFVDAPVLAALLAEHRHVLVRQHRRYVHARGVVPDEEGLVGLLGVVAIYEVDHLRRDFLVHGFGALQRQRALVLAGLVLRRAVGGFALEDRARWG